MEKCQQIEKLASLQSNQGSIMEVIKEIKTDVKEIKEYLYEKLPEHYASKSSVSRIWNIVRALIGFVFTAIGGAVIALLLDKIK